jgi:acyl dehydratase
MALNRACLGKAYSGEPVDVTLDSIERYARACNETNPRYFDPSLPGGVIAPPMYAVVVTWVPLIAAITDPELQADLLRLLHTAQEMEFFAQIRPGDRIRSDARIATIAAAGGGESLTIELRAANQREETVSEIRFTAQIRGRRDPAVGGEPRSATCDTPRGVPLAIVTEMIDADQTMRYAEASGDRNPIHVDENIARMAGLPGIIVHGLCAMAFAARAVIDTVCEGDPARLSAIALRFVRPIFPGDSLTTSIWPAIEDERLAFETANGRGLPVMRDGRVRISP